MSDDPLTAGKNPFSSEVNPYQTPTITRVADDVGGSDPSLDGAATMLRQTKPWVRFISVLTFIGAAFMVLGGLVVMVTGAVAGMPGSMGVVIGSIYIVMAILYIAPAVYLWMYADRIGLFLRQRTPGVLASALEAQKSFWKFVGIAMLIVLGVYALAIVVALFAGLAGLG